MNTKTVKSIALALHTEGSHNHKTPPNRYTIKKRLEYFRKELRAERISYSELAELQSLASHIEPSDVELLEAAGVPENNESQS